MSNYLSMSDFLFARPSILEGIARNVDLFGTMQVYNTSETDEEADLYALYADTLALQSDAKIAIDQVIINIKKI